LKRLQNPVGKNGWLGGRYLPEKITGVYMACGVIWLVLISLFVPHAMSSYIEDTAYILGTSVIIYVLLRIGVRTLRAKESALRESEDRLARILETNAGGIVVFDEGGRITFANNAAGEILGVGRDKIIGLRHDDPVWDLAAVDGGPLRDEDRPLQKVKAARLPVYDVELSLRHKSGARVLLSVNAAPLLDIAGNMAGTVVSFTDITARKKVEDTRFRKLLLAVEQSPSAIAITDLEGNIEYANPRYASMGGCTVKDVVCGKMPHECGIPETSLGEFRAAIRSGTPWGGEFRCLRKDGEAYWESTSLTPVRTEGGEIRNLLWIREDITNRKMAEEAVRRSEANYRAVVEDQTEFICRFRPDGTLTFVNDAYCRYFGKPREELIGTNFLMGLPAVDREPTWRQIAMLDRGHPSVTSDHRVRRHDGEARWQQWTERAVFDQEGDFVEFQAVGFDVTEHRLADEALAESREMFRQLFEQNEEPLFLFRGGSLEILDVNPAALQLYGCSREELMRKGIALFVPEGERANFSRAVAGITEGDVLRIERMVHHRSDGQKIIVSIRGKPIRTGGGPLVYCSFRDITLRIRMEEEARQHQAQLIHANRMTSLGTIVSGVAHEVNNPNNLVMFNAPLILSAWEDARPILDGYHREGGDFLLAGLPYSEMREVVPKLVTAISDASQRIKAIVESLKDFSRHDPGKESVPVDVNGVVRTAITILNHEILRGTHRFAASYGENLPPVMGSARRLEQIVVNLLNNALQAIHSTQQAIRIGTRKIDGTGEVEVFVEDEGIGMSAEVMERIKEPFFSTRLESGGLGLGVSICRSIAAEHGGTLEFASQEGKGTRAAVRLPAIGGRMGDAERELSNTVLGG
jgi:PAS domain S-box-containing protein